MFYVLIALGLIAVVAVMLGIYRIEENIKASIWTAYQRGKHGQPLR